ncbi:unnamed protein product [Closterium sp. NIES-54]
MLCARTACYALVQHAMQHHMHGREDPLSAVAPPLSPTLPLPSSLSHSSSAFLSLPLLLSLLLPFSPSPPRSLAPPLYPPSFISNSIITPSLAHLRTSTIPPSAPSVPNLEFQFPGLLPLVVERMQKKKQSNNKKSPVYQLFTYPPSLPSLPNPTFQFLGLLPKMVERREPISTSIMGDRVVDMSCTYDRKAKRFYLSAMWMVSCGWRVRCCWVLLGAASCCWVLLFVAGCCHQWWSEGSRIACQSCLGRQVGDMACTALMTAEPSTSTSLPCACSGAPSLPPSLSLPFSLIDLSSQSPSHRPPSHSHRPPSHSQSGGFNNTYDKFGQTRRRGNTTVGAGLIVAASTTDDPTQDWNVFFIPGSYARPLLSHLVVFTASLVLHGFAFSPSSFLARTLATLSHAFNLVPPSYHFLPCIIAYYLPSHHRFSPCVTVSLSLLSLLPPATSWIPDWLGSLSPLSPSQHPNFFPSQTSPLPPSPPPRPFPPRSDGINSNPDWRAPLLLSRLKSIPPLSLPKHPPSHHPHPLVPFPPGTMGTTRIPTGGPLFSTRQVDAQPFVSWAWQGSFIGGVTP